ncbi:MAG: HRDC domain-containing protein, partial [Pseudomonadales bacterium]|nr:HRDC domain-containing protein [Pseudomonadales bacterium]
SLAKQQPQTEKDLLNIEDITHKQRKEFGRTLLDMLHQNNSIEKQENPVFLQPLPREFNSLVKKMKQAINRVSERENLAPEIIARKKDIEALVNTFIFQGRFTLPKSLQGWRKALIGDQLLALCHQELPSCKN